ncbi:hypothetical protein F4776DRAFT_380112 [Hypoxylon sp. NC0597]|nr:hypothetical protein F4776DRAFT_380112 [Hypoxylon sp. NC0597]
MERSVPEYSQSGLPSPYPSTYGDTQSEASSADHASAAQYPSNQEARGNSYPTSATPTSEYGAYPQSARSTSSFPEHSLRQYPPASNHSGSSGDPSIAAPSPTYAPNQYSPYAPPPQDMSHNYPHSAGSLYAQPRPDWANYAHPGAPGQIPHPHPQVYSFVPIPGAQQHKRPRRRYEEIERMYKCGWNGCEKAYEFKEIRKEWKARKKEEEQQRKAAEEADRQRHAAAAAAAQNGAADPQGGDSGQAPSSYTTSRQVQLPPIGYQPTQYPAPPSATVPQQPLPEYSPTNHMYSGYQQPASPYGPAQSQNMYSQRE